MPIVHVCLQDTRGHLMKVQAERLDVQWDFSLLAAVLPY